MWGRVLPATAKPDDQSGGGGGVWGAARGNGPWPPARPRSVVGHAQCAREARRILKRAGNSGGRGGTGPPHGLGCDRRRSGRVHYLYRHVQPMSVMAGWAGSDPVGREGHQRHGASGGPTGSASARPSGGRLALLGCFTPLRQSPVGRGFGHGARRGCREALAGGGSPHLYQRRIAVCWHIATYHHAARG